MKKKKISLPQARRNFLNTQLLDGISKFPKGNEGAAQTIETLGYVQIDPLSVIHQAQHQTLWARLPGYGPEMLQEL